MTVDERTAPHGTDVLIRTVDTHLFVVRAGLTGPDVELAERLADCLRELVLFTAEASAADRARVRAAVHCFVLRREPRGRLLSIRTLTTAQHVINATAEHLGRPDLTVSTP